MDFRSIPPSRIAKMPDVRPSGGTPSFRMYHRMMIPMPIIDIKKYSPSIATLLAES
jgi:hypothetical protein